MGAAGSKDNGSAAPGAREGWAPSPPSAGKGAKLSKAGYDVTPLTAEEKQQQASRLTEFQRQVT